MKSLEQIFTELSSTNSSKEKERILKDNIDNKLLRDVCYFALSPRIKYYIKKIPDVSCITSTELTLDEALTFLEKFYTRKLTGNNAINELNWILSSLNFFDADVIKKIIQRDLKLGINTATVNKVWKNLIEETPYMGAVSFSYDKLKKLVSTDKKGCVSQIKMDGRYCNLINTKDEVITESRSGEITYLNGYFDDVLTGIDELVFNGELIIPGISRYISNGLIASIVSIYKKEHDNIDTRKERKQFEEKNGNTIEHYVNRIVYVCWDCITIEEYNKCESIDEYDIRLEKLKSVIEKINSYKIQLVYSTKINTVEEAFEDFKTLIEKGEEGTIVKGLSTKWKSGKPKSQIKCKNESFVDLRIIGFNYGTVGTKNENIISSIVVQSEEGLIQTSPAGIKEEMMIYITENQDSLLNTIVSVKCSGLSKNSVGEYSLLHPVFDELRDDKTIANTLEECIDICNSFLM